MNGAKSMGLPEWQEHVDNRLTSQDSTLTGIRAAQDGFRTEFAAHRIETKAQLDAQELATKPVVLAVQKMEKGVRVMGWLGSKTFALVTFIGTIIAIVTAWQSWRGR